MSLREEIDKLIEAERVKRVLVVENQRELALVQRDRFRAMKVIFEEFAQAVDNRYVDTVLGDSHCTVSMGTRQDNGLMKSIVEWRIEPNVDSDAAAPGFKIEEVAYGTTDDSDCCKDHYIVCDEEEVIKKLMLKFAPYLGTYRWIEGLSDGNG